MNGKITDEMETAFECLHFTKLLFYWSVKVLFHSQSSLEVWVSSSEKDALPLLVKKYVRLFLLNVLVMSHDFSNIMDIEMPLKLFILFISYLTFQLNYN